MDTVIRAVSNTADEILAGHKLWFSPVDGCDGISATANAPGFTPLIAVARRLGWDYDLMQSAAHTCNQTNEVAVVRQVTPTLILVPATRGRGDAEALAFDLLGALHASKVQNLHMTHFGFLQGRFPGSEIATVLSMLFKYGPTLPLKRLVVDVDARSERAFYELIRPKA
jgi:hypothetical protein